MTTRPIALAAAALAALVSLVAAQGPGRGASPASPAPTPSAERERAWRQHLELERSSPFRGMRWRTVGPSFIGGRIQSIALDPRRPGAFYVGVGAGNVWHTLNSGTTWTPIFERESTFTIGDVAVSPSNPDVIWVGTGEPLMARSSFAGTGVFRSADGGRTWQHVGLAETHHLARILVDPTTPDTVYVAAIGHNFSPNAERGLFKTTDGGRTWVKALYVSERVGVVDVVMDPRNNRRLWAVAWERDRRPWNNEVAGPGSGVYRTEDGGKTWSKVTKGLPAGPHLGRVGLAIAPSRPDIMYAVVDNRTPLTSVGQDARSSEPPVIGGELYRSADGGRSWRKANAGPLGTAIGYDFCIARVSPDNPDEIYVLGNYLRRSRDGGKTFETLDGRGRIVHLRPHGGKMLHLDDHALVIDPSNPNRLLLGTDGGLYVSEDRGANWLHVNNLPIGEFYAIALDGRDPYRIYGGTQDNAAVFGTAVALRDDEPEPWEHVYLDPWTGGDSYFTLPDPLDPAVVYFEHQFGDLRRKNLASGETVRIQPAAAKGQAPLRFNWMTPFLISAHNPFTLYYGANRVLKSVDRGAHWKPISGDLTTSPGADRRGNVPFGTITSLAESPSVPGLLVAGTDDGRVQVTEDDGATWRDVTAGLPAKWVSRVAASAHDSRTLYVSLTGYREDDFEKYLFMSPNLGLTWKSIAENLPSESINVVREDPVRADILYVGTDLGVFVSLDKGGTWHSLKANLPTCAVHDLAVHPRQHELVIGTHGRGIFVIDARPIEALNDDVKRAGVHVFAVRPASPPRHRRDDEPARQPGGDGAVIHYWLQVPGCVTVAVRDGAGQVVRTITAAGSAGVNAVTWDLRVEEKRAEAERAPRMRDAAPGEFLVEVTSGSERGSATARLLPFASR